MTSAQVLSSYLVLTQKRGIYTSDIKQNLIAIIRYLHHAGLEVSENRRYVSLQGTFPYIGILKYLQASYQQKNNATQQPI